MTRAVGVVNNTRYIKSIPRYVMMSFVGKIFMWNFLSFVA